MNNFIANRVHCCLNRLLHLVVDIIFECDVISEDKVAAICIYSSSIQLSHVTTKHAHRYLDHAELPIKVLYPGRRCVRTLLPLNYHVPFA